jgi:hypothetical protein
MAPERLSERVQRVAERVTAHLGAQRVPVVPPVDVSAVRRGQALFFSGAVDEAATLLDGALEEASHAPHQIARGDAPALIAGLVLRATIALARGEVARARALLARLVLYDPEARLEPLERNPQLEAAFRDVRASADRTLAAAEMAAACHAADVVLVGRAAAAEAVEIVRFDACRPVATAVGSGVDALVTTLSGPSAPARPSPRARPPLYGGVTLLVAGAVLAGAGIALAADAARRAGALGADCLPPAMSCPDAELARRRDAYDRARISSSVLLPIGAAALLGGSILTAVLSRRAKGAAPALAAGVFRAVLGGAF